MPRFSTGVLTGAGGTTTPLASLYSPADAVGTLREWGVFNTTAVALAIRLARLSTANNQPSTIVEALQNPKKNPPRCTAYGTHSGVETVSEDLGYRGVLGASVGSAVIWTFGDDGLVLGAVDAAEAITNGIGLVLENGTGQILQTYWVWDE